MVVLALVASVLVLVLAVPVAVVDIAMVESNVVVVACMNQHRLDVDLAAVV